MFLHACIFGEYTAIEDVITDWKTKSEEIAVIQHPADGKTKRIHCHILIKPLVGEDAYRSSLKRIIPTTAKTDYWIMTKTKKTRVPIDKDITLAYMTKGYLDASALKTITEQDIEDAKRRYLAGQHADSGGHSAPPSMLDELENLANSHFADFLANPQQMQIPDFLRSLSRFIFATFYRKTRKAPNGAQHKQFTSTVFLRLCEEAQRRNPQLYIFQQGIDSLMEKWY